MLTQKQADFLALFIDSTKRNRFQPTNKEMCELMGWSSPNAAQVFFNTLVKKGYLQNSVPRKARGYKILKDQFGNPVSDVFSHQTESPITFAEDLAALANAGFIKLHQNGQVTLA